MSISQDGTKCLEWYGIPDELSPAQKDFMKKHALNFSSGYIGMLRLYRDVPSDKCRYARTPWQSSGGANVCSQAIGQVNNPKYRGAGSWPFATMEELQEQGINFLNHLMSLSDDQLQKKLDGETPLL